MRRQHQALIFVAFGSGLTGCGDLSQSPLAPGAVQAERIADLAWLLFAGGTIILLLVLLFVAAALYGPGWLRRILAEEGLVMWIGIGLPVVVLSGLLIHSLSLLRAELWDQPDDAMRIEVVGEQWWWRITYTDSDGKRVASANEIRIPVGQPVEFVLTSTDVIHSFWVPNLAGKIDMIPGRATHLRVLAQQPGVYRGQCAEYCGGAHALMAFEVIAMSPENYQAWLKREAGDARAPQTPSEEAGLKVFLSTGCGACHAVRGTPAHGTIGPDLTHLAGRRQLAAASLPMARETLAGFITDSQAVKPNNLMPRFGLFSPQELKALTDYLMSLEAP